MAAGLVLRTITVSAGVDVPTRMWADDTVTPTQLTPVHIFIDTAGVPVAPLTDTQLRAAAVPVTANAGTNLNTSALALEAGGNLAAVATDAATIASDTTALVAATPAAGPAFPDSSTPVVLAKRNYKTVAASQTDATLGAAGATGDYLGHLVIVPATTSPGAVSIKDGAGSAITLFTGGASSVGSLVPFSVPIDAVSAAGAWKVTTGAAVSVVANGTFTEA